MTNTIRPVEKMIPVLESIYKDLQLVMKAAFANEDTSWLGAYEIARSNEFVAVAEWINNNRKNYEYGVNTGLWMLDNCQPFDGNVVCKYFEGVSANYLTNVPKSVVNASVCGFSWGYSGAGGSDLALNILNWFIPPNEDNKRSLSQGYASNNAIYWCGAFRDDFIAPMSLEGGSINCTTIEDWLIKRGELKNKPHSQSLVLGGNSHLLTTEAVLGIVHRSSLKDRCIRELDGCFHFLSRPEKIWKSTSYWYLSLEELCQKQGVVLGESGKDEHGKFWLEKRE